MKKKIILLAFFLAFTATVFAENVNSKNGYFKLKWGTTVEDAKKAGYKLTAITDKDVKEQLSGDYTQPVDFYSVEPNDKNVKIVIFAYYMDKFFSVTESVSWDGSQKKLENRYGNFKDNGIIAIGEKQFMDGTVGTDGKLKNLSIVIFNDKDTASVAIFDWAIYKNISLTGRELSGQSESSIVEKLFDLAGKLIQPEKNGSKPKYAFLALSTDSKNTAVENYVTDGLTEAAFNTGKVKIFERANLEKILSEQKFQASGLVNEDTAKSIGNIAGVDYVCYGTLKDLGDQITINARVVDVETGEICAMSRATIDKDDYLKQNSVVTSDSGSKNVTKAAPSAKKTVNTLWTVRKSRNEFDGYTTYTFILKGPLEDRQIFVGYDKNDIESKSLVKAGFVWGIDNAYSQTGTYDIKKEDGSKITKEYKNPYTYWSYDTGWKNGNERFKFSWNKGESARFILDLISNNDYLTIRKGSTVQRFQTAGFWDFVEAQGITKEEIETAIANEEF